MENENALPYSTALLKNIDRYFISSHETHIQSCLRTKRTLYKRCVSRVCVSALEYSSVQSRCRVKRQKAFARPQSACTEETTSAPTALASCYRRCGRVLLLVRRCSLGPLCAVSLASQLRLLAFSALSGQRHRAREGGRGRRTVRMKSNAARIAARAPSETMKRDRERIVPGFLPSLGAATLWPCVSASGRRPVSGWRRIIGPAIGDGTPATRFEPPACRAMTAGGRHQKLLGDALTVAACGVGSRPPV